MTTTPTPTAYAAMGEQLAAAIAVQQQAIIEAAKAWAEKLPASHEEALFPAECAILDAVRALAPLTPVLLEEPGDGSIVLDKDGDLWRRSGGRWKCLNEDMRGRGWRQLLDEFGPITRLVPATDVVDTGIVRRLADALRTHALAKHIDHKASFGEARFDDCTAPSCREISALLVLAEGATGGGR